MRSFSVLATSSLLVVTSFLISAMPIAAAPLDPAHVPADAKWVVHVDFEALTASELMEAYRDKRPKKANRFRKWMRERYGIDPREDLKGLTLFSNTYESHSGAAVLHAKYDPEKVESDVLSKPRIKTTEWQDHTLYTWKVKRRRHRMHRQRDSHHDHDDAADHHHAGDDGRTITAVLLDDNRIVFAPSESRAKSAIKFLEGDEPTLESKESRLVTGVPEGAFLYGAAIDLKDISRRERPFPILQQLEYAMWAAGERNGEMFEELTLEARDEETAREMEKVLEGFVALSKIWSADMKAFAELYDHVHVRQNGTTVHLEWHGDTDETIEGMEELVARLKQLRDAGRKRN